MGKGGVLTKYPRHRHAVFTEGSQLVKLPLEIGTADLDQAVVETPEGTRTLRPLEARLLEHLAASPGEVHTSADLLSEVWGYRSGVETRTLYATVNRLRRAVERDPKHPVHVVTVPRVGYRFVPLSTASPASLPRRAGECVGVDDELEALSAAMDDREVVALVGPPGVGKSRLALEWAHRHPDGVVWVGLADVEGVDDALRKVASALGLQPVPRDVEGGVRQALAGRGLLLVLDDADRAQDGLSERLPDDVRLLVTTRSAASWPGVHIVPVAPLPNGRGQASERLLLQLVRTRNPDFDFPDDPWVTDLLAALDGLPLALELAAPWLTVFSGPELVQRITEGWEDLSRAGAGRHASLEACLRWSWTLLQPWEQRVLSELSVFVGPFDLLAARAICDVSPWPDAPPLHEVVLGLLECSWLRVSSQRGRQRFELFAGHRVFAGEQAAAGVVQEARQRQVARFVAWAARVDAEVLHMSGGREPVELLEVLPEAIQAASWAIGDERAAITALIGRLLLQHEPLERTVRLLDAALEQVSNPVLRLTLQRFRGVAMRTVGRADEARAILRSALAEAVDHPLEQARLHCALGVLESAHGTAAEAQEHLEAALASFDVAGRPLDEAVVHAELATLRYLEGDLVQAAALLERALARLREGGESWVYALYLGNLAAVELVADFLESSACHLREALALHRRFGTARGEALVLGNLALVEERRGAFADALAHTIEALAIAERLGDTCQQGNLWSTRGLVEVGNGRPQEAMRCLDRALGIAELRSLPRLRVEVLVRRARARVALGEPEKALEEVDAAEPSALELNLHTEVMEAGLARVEALVALGSKTAAQKALDTTIARAGRRKVPDLTRWRAAVEAL